MSIILLASSGQFITESGVKLSGKLLPEIALSYITTASRGVKDKAYVVSRRLRMQELKFNFHEFDIEGKHESEVRAELADKGAVYVEGGNTFYLLKCMRKSGFDRVVVDLVAQGLIYIGSSAGAYVACPTIEMATWRHQDKYDRGGITDFAGLGLVPFLVTVHYQPEYLSSISAGVGAARLSVRVLTDTQALLVEDDKVSLLGSGAEVVVT